MVEWIIGIDGQRDKWEEKWMTGWMDGWTLGGLMSVGRQVDEMEGRQLDDWKFGWEGGGWGKWRGRGYEKALGGTWGREGLCLSRDSPASLGLGMVLGEETPRIWSPGSSSD